MRDAAMYLRNHRFARCQLLMLVLLLLATGCGPRYDTVFVANNIEPSSEVGFQTRQEDTRVRADGFEIFVWLKRWERSGQIDGHVMWKGDQNDAVTLDTGSVTVGVMGRSADREQQPFQMIITRRMLAEKPGPDNSEYADDFIIFFTLRPPAQATRLDPYRIDLRYQIEHSNGRRERKCLRIYLRPRKTKAFGPIRTSIDT